MIFFISEGINLSKGDAVSANLSVTVVPGQKWALCDLRGRDNLYYNVTSSQPVYIFVGTQAHQQACHPEKLSSCKGFDSKVCGRKKSCSGMAMGELSNREKCIVVVHGGNQSAVVRVHYQLKSPGNYGAIVFGLVVVSLALVVVITAGMVVDIRKMRAQFSRSSKKGPVRQAADVDKAS